MHGPENAEENRPPLVRVLNDLGNNQLLYELDNRLTALQIVLTGSYPEPEISNKLEAEPKTNGLIEQAEQDLRTRRVMMDRLLEVVCNLQDTIGRL